MSREALIRQVLPHDDLAEFVESYGVYETAIPENHVGAAGLIGFNPHCVDLWIDGEKIIEPVLFCAIRNPAQFSLQVGGGPVFWVRVRAGALDRLLQVDPREAVGVTIPDRDAHRSVVELSKMVTDNCQNPVEALCALDAGLRERIADAKPVGLAERFFLLVRDAAGSVAVADAVDQLGCTVRTLERACKSRFARTPKRIILGFRAAHTLFRERDEGGRPELHPDFAYADLPHYANDLRKISGLTRTQNFAQMDRDASLPIRRGWLDGRFARDEAGQTRWREDYDRLNALALSRWVADH